MRLYQLVLRGGGGDLPDGLRLSRMTVTRSPSAAISSRWWVMKTIADALLAQLLHDGEQLGHLARR